MKRGAGAALLGVAAVGIVAAVGYGVLTSETDLFTDEQCTVEVDEHRVTLSQEQAENASLITAISVRRGLPARAASIALATAYQESDLFNIEHGDRDSVGLFQQRPSQGWGSVDEILDPVYSTNAFYDALVEIDGYESMEITVAAQEADARAIASALTGHSAGGFTCEVSDNVDESDPALTDSGLTERAESVREEALGVFGDLQLGGFQPGGVGDGHMSGSTHYDGRAVDIFVRPVGNANNVRGWAMAQYFVAQAERLHVQTVIFDDRIWTAGDKSGDGWRDYDPPERSGDPAILEHRDHVHVDVF
jgi:hypothetical protein